MLVGIDWLDGLHDNATWDLQSDVPPQHHLLVLVVQHNFICQEFLVKDLLSCMDILGEDFSPPINPPRPQQIILEEENTSLGAGDLHHLHPLSDVEQEMRSSTRNSWQMKLCWTTRTSKWCWGGTPDWRSQVALSLRPSSQSMPTSIGG